MKTATKRYSYKSALLLLAILAYAAILASAASGMEPLITIMEPKDGAEVAAGDIIVLVQVQNFSLVNKLGEPNVAGEGHIHYFIDVAAPTAEGIPAITAPGTYAPTPNTTFTWTNVTAGIHNLSVELVNNEHTPLVPAVVAMVNITAKAAQENMSAENVTIDLIARNIAFNTKSIIVPAGAHVTVNFDDQDANVAHNFAVYESPAAQETIFKGALITGPEKTIYTFDAPKDPGTYYFQCDPHSRIMNGQFIVQ